MVLRLVLLVGVLFLVFVLVVNGSVVNRLYQKLPGIRSLLSDSRIKGLTNRLPLTIYDPKDIVKTLQNLATPSAQKLLQPILNDLQQSASQLPEQALNNLPRLIEIITNAKKEELYLISPRSLIVPKINPTDSKQEILIQLDQFEIRNTRKSGRPWTLTIQAQTDAGLAENITFKLNKSDIRALDGTIDGINVEEGNKLKIWSVEGKGKGTFQFNPFIKIDIPKDIKLENTRIEIETVFE